MLNLDQELLDRNDVSDSSLRHYIQGEAWKNVGSE